MNTKMSENSRYRRPKQTGETTVRVSRNVHTAVKAYAAKHNLPVTTAVDRLLTAGLQVLWLQK